MPTPLILPCLGAAFVLSSAPAPVSRANAAPRNPASSVVLATARCDSLLRTLFSDAGSAAVQVDPVAVAAACSENVEWVDQLVAWLM